MKTNSKISWFKSKSSSKIIIALISTIGLTITSVFFTQSSTSLNQKNTKGVNNGKVENQTNYFGPVVNNSPQLESTRIQIENKKETGVPVKEKTKIVYKSSKSNVKDTTPKEPPVSISANNALIITQGQTGGNNTVVTPIVNLPTPEITFFIDSANIPVNEIINDRMENETFGNATLSDKNIKFYKHQVSAKFYSKYIINGILFLLKRNDVLDISVHHSGTTHLQRGLHKTLPFITIIQPEIGLYTFIVYTLNPVKNIIEDFHVE